VDRCWKSKERLIREGERDAAKAAYDAARQLYEKLAIESFDDRQSGEGNEPAASSE
jgi:hypothetical protein